MNNYKVITKKNGLELLQDIENDSLSCGTMIRHLRQDLIKTAGESTEPVYEYYKFTKGDGRFHRCDEDGKLGAKGQCRFMNYSTLNKNFEILELVEEPKYVFEFSSAGVRVYPREAEIIEEDKKIEKLKIEYDDGDVGINGIYLTSNHSEIFANKINEIIDRLNELLKEEK